MSIYAYEDNLRTKELYSTDQNITKYINKPCFCPDKKCNAIMHITGVGTSVNPYFRALKTKPHKKGCYYGSKNNFNINNYNEKLFKMPDALKNLQKPTSNSTNGSGSHSNNKTNNSNNKPLKTIKAIYHMAKNRHIHSTYNNFSINEILVDDRNYDYYSNGVSGYRIIECSYYSYDKNSQIIYMNYPSTNCHYYLQLKIANKKLFNQIVSLVSNTNHNTGKFAVSGEWDKKNIPYNTTNMLNSKNNNRIIKASCKITSKKQIGLIQKE